MDKIQSRCISGIITNSDGEVLLEDHVKTGAWTFPGGKCDGDEEVNKAVVRELFEELGILAYRYHIYKQVQFEDIEYPVGTGKYSGFHHTYFIIDEYKGTITNKEPNKHLNLKWIKPEDIRNSCRRISAVLNKYLELQGL